MNVISGGVCAGIVATNVNVALVPAGSERMLQFTVPVVSPGLGIVQVNAGPLSCVNDTNSIPTGIGSLSAAPAASSGPMFVTVIEKETLLPAAAVVGLLLLTARSASCARASSAKREKTARSAARARVRTCMIPPAEAAGAVCRDTVFGV